MSGDRIIITADGIGSLRFAFDVTFRRKPVDTIKFVPGRSVEFIYNLESGAREYSVSLHLPDKAAAVQS